jgi:hypothetical protein
MKLMCVMAIAALGAACGPGASDSHNSSQAGGAARGGVADPNRQQPVTLTGCLQNADKPDAATGTSGSAGRSAAGGSDQLAAGKGSIGERFTLTNASTQSGEAHAGAAGYILDGNVEALRGNVNTQVRVTGVLDRGTYSASESQRVRVDTVEPMGGACGTPR